MATGRGGFGVVGGRRAAGGAAPALALLLAGCGGSDPASAPAAADAGADNDAGSAAGNVAGNVSGDAAAPAAGARSSTLRRDSRVLERPARSPVPADRGNAARD